MSQAIVTKYHGPGNRRGSRISATAQAGRIYFEYDDALNAEMNHRMAAQELCKKFDWPNELIGGGLPGRGNGMVWVFKK